MRAPAGGAALASRRQVPSRVGGSGRLRLLGARSGIISADTASGISLVCTGLSFWMALALAPWVRIQRADDMQAQWLALKAGMGVGCR